MSFQNPVIPGFYPDPSCIRVGHTYYMINSSFQFFPGLPIHRSTDLVNWELIGHAICRPTQIDLSLATTKVNRPDKGEFFTAGLYAPTIRYHRGIFYIVCTNLSGRHNIPQSEDFAPRNFIITAKDLSDSQSFSNPIYFEFHGIDPSLLFDNDGKVYMQGSWIFGYRNKPATTIKQAEINLETGQLRSELHEIWTGTGDKCPEGPHTYKKDGRYWLIIAEGGTHRTHKITAACSDYVWGPYRSYDGNPLLTTQGNHHSIQCVGHGDFFEDTDGNWWCVMLARREFGSAYPLGRETFLAPVQWPMDVFPLIDNLELQHHVGETRPLMNHNTKRKVPPHNVTLDSLHTIYLRSPCLESYNEDGDGLYLKASLTPLGAPEGTTTFVGRRQTSLSSEASVVLHLDSITKSGHCGLAIYKDTFRYVTVDVDSEGKLSLGGHYPGKELEDSEKVDVATNERVKLAIRSTCYDYTVTYQTLRNEEWSSESKLGLVPASAISGDDFTGAIYGIYANGLCGVAKFTGFQVREL